MSVKRAEARAAVALVGSGGSGPNTGIRCLLVELIETFSTSSHSPSLPLTALTLSYTPT